MRFYQTANDLTNYLTDDPAGNYQTKQDDEAKRRKELGQKPLNKR